MKSERLVPPISLFFLKILLAIWGLLCLHRLKTTKLLQFLLQPSKVTQKTWEEKENLFHLLMFSLSILFLSDGSRFYFIVSFLFRELFFSHTSSRSAGENFSVLLLRMSQCPLPFWRMFSLEFWKDSSFSPQEMCHLLPGPLVSEELAATLC